MRKWRNEELEKGGNVEICTAGMAGWFMAALGSYTFQVSTGLAGIRVSRIFIVYQGRLSFTSALYRSRCTSYSTFLRDGPAGQTSIIVSIVLYQESMHSIGYG